MSYTNSLGLALVPRTYPTQIVDKNGNPLKFTPKKIDDRLGFQKVLEELSRSLHSSSTQINSLLSRKIIEGTVSKADITLKQEIGADTFARISPLLNKCHQQFKGLEKKFEETEITSLLCLLAKCDLEKILNHPNITSSLTYQRQAFEILCDDSIRDPKIWHKALIIFSSKQDKKAAWISFKKEVWEKWAEVASEDPKFAHDILTLFDCHRMIDLFSIEGLEVKEIFRNIAADLDPAEFQKFVEIILKKFVDEIQEIKKPEAVSTAAFKILTTFIELLNGNFSQGLRESFLCLFKECDRKLPEVVEVFFETLPLIIHNDSPHTELVCSFLGEVHLSKHQALAVNLSKTLREARLSNTDHRALAQTMARMGTCDTVLEAVHHRIMEIEISMARPSSDQNIVDRLAKIGEDLLFLLSNGKINEAILLYKKLFSVLKGSSGDVEDKLWDVWSEHAAAHPEFAKGFLNECDTSCLSEFYLHLSPESAALVMRPLIEEKKSYLTLLTKCAEYANQNVNLSVNFALKIVLTHQKLYPHTDDAKILSVLLPVIDNFVYLKKHEKLLKVFYDLVTNFWGVADNPMRMALFPIAEKLLTELLSAQRSSSSKRPSKLPPAPSPEEALKLSRCLRGHLQEGMYASSSVLTGLCSIGTQEAYVEVLNWVFDSIPLILQTQGISRDIRKNRLIEQYIRLECVIPFSSTGTVALIMGWIDDPKSHQKVKHSVLSKILLRLFELNEIEMLVPFLLAHFKNLDPRQVVADRLFFKAVLSKEILGRLFNSFELSINKDPAQFLQFIDQIESSFKGNYDLFLTELLFFLNRIAKNSPQRELLLKRSSELFIKHKDCLKKLNKIEEYVANYIGCFLEPEDPTVFDQGSLNFMYQLLSTEPIMVQTVISNMMKEPRDHQRVLTLSDQMIHECLGRALSNSGNIQAVQIAFGLFYFMSPFISAQGQDNIRFRGLNLLHDVMQNKSGDPDEKLAISRDFFNMLNGYFLIRIKEHRPLGENAPIYLERIEKIIDRIRDFPNTYKNLILNILTSMVHLVYEENCLNDDLVRVLLKIVRVVELAAENVFKELPLMALLTQPNIKNLDKQRDLVCKLIQALTTDPAPSVLSLSFALSALQNKSDYEFKDHYEMLLGLFSDIRTTAQRHLKGQGLPDFLDLMLSSLPRPRHIELSNTEPIVQEVDLHFALVHTFLDEYESIFTTLGRGKTIICSEILFNKLSFYYPNFRILGTKFIEQNTEKYLIYVLQYINHFETFLKYKKFTGPEEENDIFARLCLSIELLDHNVFNDILQLAPSSFKLLQQIMIKWIKLIAPNYSHHYEFSPMTWLASIENIDQWIDGIFKDQAELKNEFLSYREKILQEIIAKGKVNL